MTIIEMIDRRHSIIVAALSGGQTLEVALEYAERLFPQGKIDAALERQEDLAKLMWFGTLPSTSPLTGCVEPLIHKDEPK